MSTTDYISGPMTDRVLDRIRTTSGLYLPDKPTGGMPVLPVDITVLGDEELMILYTDFIAWADYAAAQLAVAAAEEREAARRHDLKKAKELAAAKSGTVTAARAAAETEAAEDGYEASERYAYRKVLESISVNLERDAALLSRELSRRLGDNKPSGRSRRLWGTA